MKKHLYTLLLTLISLSLFAQDAPPSGATVVSPNFTWYKNIIAGDTLFYGYSNNNWVNFARRNWVNKQLIDGLALKANVMGGNTWTGFNNFQDVGASRLFLSSYGGTPIAGDISAGNLRVSSLNSGPFIGVTSYRNSDPKFRWGERAGGGSFVVQKWNGGSWADVLVAGATLDSSYVTKAQLDSLKNNVIANQSDTIQGGNFKISGVGNANVFIAGNGLSSNYSVMTPGGFSNISGPNIFNISGSAVTFSASDDAYGVTKNSNGVILYSNNKDVLLSGAHVKSYATPTQVDDVVRLSDLTGYAKLYGENIFYGENRFQDRMYALQGIQSNASIAIVNSSLEIISTTAPAGVGGFSLRHFGGQRGFYFGCAGCNNDDRLIYDNSTKTMRFGSYNQEKRILVQGDVPDSVNISNNYIKKSGGTMTGDLILPSATPTNALSAAPKAYIDNLITGITWKNAVRVKTTTNITLSGTQTIDGVSLSIGNRVLVNNQTTQSQNGIYAVAASTWTRVTDADESSEIETATVAVTAGIANKNTQWTYVGVTAPVIGTDAILFGQISGAGTYSNGTYLTLSGNVFDANLTTFDGRYALAARYVTSGYGLSGGGNLSADRTFSVDSTLQVSKTFLQNYTYTKAQANANYVNMAGAQNPAGAKTWANLQTFTSGFTSNAASNVNKNINDAVTAFIVNQQQGTGNVQQWQFANSTVAGVQGNGTFYGGGIYSIGSSSNAFVQLNTTGTSITRNIADGNAALTVNQINTSSTGNILNLQFGGSNVAFMDNGGNLYANRFNSITSANNAQVNASINGTVISRNIADTNPALIINNVLGTGDIFRVSQNGSSKFSIDLNGNTIISNRVSINTNSIQPAQFAIGTLNTFSTTQTPGLLGFGIRQDPQTYISSAASGTYATGAINSYGVGVFSAPSATTITKAYGNYFTSPAGSANVTLTNSYSLGTSGDIEIGGSFLAAGRSAVGKTTAAGGVLDVDASSGFATANPFSALGFGLRLGGSGVTYTSNAVAGTPAMGSTMSISGGTYAALNAQTLSNAASLYIAGPPVAGTNVTISNGSYSLWVNGGNAYFGSSIISNGAVLQNVANAYSSGNYSTLVRNATNGRYETIDLTAFNTTTTTLSSATLNSTYPTAPLGFRVICGNITAGGIIYIKYATSTWLSINAPVQP